MRDHTTSRLETRITAAAARRRQPVHKQPLKSDQAPGEETVQVNDRYVGGSAPPSLKPSESDQHQTGG
jgi:hypothetical protein